MPESGGFHQEFVRHSIHITLREKKKKKLFVPYGVILPLTDRQKAVLSTILAQILIIPLYNLYNLKCIIHKTFCSHLTDWMPD